jgi:glutaredoxin
VGTIGREPADLDGKFEADVHRVTLITRVGCHLCEDAEIRLRELADELDFQYEELDVDSDQNRRSEYSDRVPVILIDGKEHGYWRLEEDRFRRAIAK